MSDVELRSLSDFEWASVAQYLVYIGSMAGLEEINSEHVVSFPLARMGADRVVSQKKRVLLVLGGNRAKIERFVGEFEADLDDNEMSVLRGLYVQYTRWIETVERHISVAMAWCVCDQLALFPVSEVDDYDGPF